ncbi:hypothetical protein A4X03_0g9335, partial [Tilletia caries]
MSSHASISPSLPGRRPHVQPHQHHDAGLDVSTLDPRTLAIIAEMRTMREDLHARFDAVSIRLTAVEQLHQQQPERDNPVDDSIGIDPTALADADRRASFAPVHHPPDRHRTSAETAWSPAGLDDRFVNTTRGPTHPRPVQPITPRHPPSNIPPAPPTSPYGSVPLARYRLLPGAEQGRIKKALGRVGLSLEHILGSVDTAADEDPPDDDEDPPMQSPPPALSTPARPTPADSSASPLRLRAHVADTPTPELSPAPTIRLGQPLICRQEFIGDYSGDPYRLDAFLSRDRPPWKRGQVARESVERS